MLSDRMLVASDPKEDLVDNDLPGVSDAFQAFLHEAPAHAGAWMNAVQRLGSASALDDKTEALAYLAVLAAARLTSGVPFHARHAKSLGATADGTCTNVAGPRALPVDREATLVEPPGRTARAHLS